MAKKQKNASNKSRPIVIAILSVLGYIGAVFTLLFGLAFLIAGPAIISFLVSSNLTQGIPSIILDAGTAIIVFIGVIFIALAILDYFIARGLWKGQNWARIITIIFAALGFISSIQPFNLVSLIIDGLIIWYLGFYKPAVNYFR